MYGLFFENGGLFGYTANRQQIKIDLATGAGTFDKNVAGINSQIFGAASLPSTGPKPDPRTSVPEPGTLFGLIGVGILGAGSLMKNKRKSASSAISEA